MEDPVEPFDPDGNDRHIQLRGDHPDTRPEPVDLSVLGALAFREYENAVTAIGRFACEFKAPVKSGALWQRKYVEKRDHEGVASLFIEPIEDATLTRRASHGDQVFSDQGWPETYIGDLGKPPSEHSMKHERQWKFGDVINPLIDQGMRLERLEEHPDPFWDAMPRMTPDMLRRLPQTYSLLMSKL